MYLIQLVKNHCVASRGRPIWTSGTSEPIETSVNRSHHGTNAGVVKKSICMLLDSQA